MMRRLGRWWYGSDFYKRYARIANRFYDWWHPLVSDDEPADPRYGYYGYHGRRRQGRISLAWRRLRHWWRETAVAKRLRLWQNAFIEWWHL